MATFHQNLGFDTLGFAQALIARGYEQKQAEAMAVVTRDYVIRGMATNEFVHATIQETKTELKHEIDKVSSKIDTEIEKVRHEITASEKRMTMTMGKMLAFVTGIILAGIPIIQAVITKLG